MATTVRPGAKAKVPAQSEEVGAHIGGPPGAPDVRQHPQPEPPPDLAPAEGEAPAATEEVSE